MANRLREMRKKSGLTQETLAKKSQVSRSVIARFETGRTEMSTKNLTRITAALGCSMDDILKEERKNGKAV